MMICPCDRQDADLEVGLLFRVLLHELSEASAFHTLERLQLAVLEL